MLFSGSVTALIPLYTVCVFTAFTLSQGGMVAHWWEEGYREYGNLVVIDSPYRSLVGPLLAYIDAVDRNDADDLVTVVLPEFIPRHWWERLLHNRTALRLKAALLFRPGTVLINVPFHLRG